MQELLTVMKQNWKNYRMHWCYR